MSSKFGVLEAFRALGCLLARLVAGFLIVNKVVEWEPFGTALVFLSISAFFFLLLLRETGGVKQFIPSVESYPKGGLSEEIWMWRRVGGNIFPLLFLIAVSTLYDAFFMTLGPIVAERLVFEPFDGLFMTAYFAPSDRGWAHRPDNKGCWREKHCYHRVIHRIGHPGNNFIY
ncbi:hypothetical protein [Methanocalculus sp.]|nr:hypothetical protein [Methanocalculus sp.]HIJ06162.1 hypothetical protein [Methanocalculus sp.]